MSTEPDSSIERPEGAGPSVITFGDPVEHDANVHDYERVFNDVRWALVEYAPGSRREGWCTQPHMGYVISGGSEYSFEDGRPRAASHRGQRVRAAAPARPRRPQP